MEKMIDLRRPKPPEKKGKTAGGVEAATEPYYEERPYCLRFTLESPELEALGLTPQTFKEMEPFTATVVLDPINIRDIEAKTENDYDKNRNKSVEVQVMKISIGSLTRKKESKVKAFNDQNKKGPGE